ncbi:MAG: bifunctional YncE family protein/alkaline phosphatase family protein, partial [Prolixibacteraceae bacterium]|nr:bifunctional YncE family protein/alkaline phosphatase family protein [Prolixibacteraceae bacterium]
NDSGQSVLLSVEGSKKSYVICVSWNGYSAKLRDYYTYAPHNSAEYALPNQMLMRHEGQYDYLYVVLNGNSELVKKNAKDKSVIWRKSTGVAPFGIVEANGKIYVSNWGGRLPDTKDVNIAGVPWGTARIDPLTGATREGSVSVYDPEDGKLIKEIVTGLHPGNMAVSSDGKYIYVANANSDDVSVINSIKDEVCETITMRLQSDINDFWGDSPNALAVTSDGKYLYVAEGLDNAIAVVRLGKLSSAKGKEERSLVEGFIPTGAYPSSIVLSGRKLYVTNFENKGAGIPKPQGENNVMAYNSHNLMASVSVIPVPKKRKLKKYNREVIVLNNIQRIKLVNLPERKNIAERPVPERIGEPSVFKHVIYIIKENRTYDQILGDTGRGESEPSLCVYGKRITPNTHKLTDDFLLMDNYMVSGKSSAEGHQWTDASIVTDYLERNVRVWYRGYPHVQTDALVYAPTGFIWDNAIKHNKTVKIYGEAAIPQFDHNKYGWKDFYEGYLKGDIPPFKNYTTIADVRPLLSKNYPGYDSHCFPDVLRADVFIKDIKKYEQMEGDQLPQLMVLALPADHTAGTNPKFPTPRAMVADNDLALGRIVEALSKSRFWKNTVIFVTEDDSQAGWDHISAYRTVGLVISPYSRKKEVVHTAYNQPCIVHTIEQILGIPPMNIMDAIAPLMTDCFTNTADVRGYKAVKNNIPLDEMNRKLSDLKGKALNYAKKSMDSQF